MRNWGVKLLQCSEWNSEESFFLRFYLFIFRERRREGERERNINVCLPLVCPTLGTWLTTQACALIGTQTGNPWVLRLALNPLSHTSQGWRNLFLNPRCQGLDHTSNQQSLLQALSKMCVVWKFFTRFPLPKKNLSCGMTEHSVLLWWNVNLAEISSLGPPSLRFSIWLLQCHSRIPVFILLSRCKVLISNQRFRHKFHVFF